MTREGSGKTITSFKTALFLSTRGGFDKVVFLVDRRALDNKTSENFKAYASYESVSVDDTKHTYHLKKKLLSSHRGIIVTTTFKLHNLVKEMEEAGDTTLSDKNIVFIIDEAHRTTMGQMMGSIKRYFRKKGLFYGFTGTPLFDENEATGMIDEKSEVIDTTEKLFGPELHKYTIDQAIADGNVLGFHVDYINTGEFISHDNLREQIAEEIKADKPSASTRSIEQELYQWTKAEVERKAVKRRILSYHDELHIPRVVKDILVNWESQSQSRHFNAILTVAYKKRVMAYYKEFRKQLAKQDYKINVAMTFSFGNENTNEVEEPSSREGTFIEMQETMFKDYAKFTGIEFVYGDNKRGEDAYFEDLVDRSTRGGSGRNQKNIDLIIVADQLLTGYDSKYLNTLYVDRSLEKQGLIQAYSRTNRVYGKNKEFGTIVNFKYPAITEELVNIALKLYGSGGKSSRAIVEHYSTAVDKFTIKVEQMKENLPEPTNWAVIEASDEEREKFMSSFLDANEQLRSVMQYYEFEWDDTKFGIDEHTWMQYTGAYKNLRSKPEETDPVDINPLVGKTKLVGSQIIDADYIIKLIGSEIKADKGIQSVDTETLRIIHEHIQELSDMGDNQQARLLKEFVDTELVPGNLPSDSNFDELFENWKKKRMDKEIVSFAKDWGIDEYILSESIDQYSVVKEEVIPYIDELSKSVNYKAARNKEAGSHLQHVMTLINEELPKWLLYTKQKYD